MNGSYSPQPEWRVSEQPSAKPAAFLGIDPGASGGLAIVDAGGVVRGVTKMGETERDTYAWLRSHSSAWDLVGCIEAVHAMPKQGVSSTFKFGRSLGFLRGLLIALEIPFWEARPQEWQKVMECRSKGDKNVTKARAQQLFPGEKVTHAVADALLIASFARRKYGPADTDRRLG